MQTHKYIWNAFQSSGIVNFVVKSSVAAAITLLFGGAALGVSTGTSQVYTSATCPDNEHTYSVADDSILATIAGRSDSFLSAVALPIQTAHSNSRYLGQGVCSQGLTSHSDIADSSTFQRAVHASSRETTFKTTIFKRAAKMKARPQIAHAAIVQQHARPSGPDAVVTVSSSTRRASSYNQATRSVTARAVITAGNVFPYGACTWYADQRYYQLHGSFVPWQSNANAWQWTARAYEYGWHVSSMPTPGSIIVLQGGVQGASWLGHVGVVERVLGGGRVVASSMNWGASPGAVTYWSFSAGPGVTFING